MYSSLELMQMNAESDPKHATRLQDHSGSGKQWRPDVRKSSLPRLYLFKGSLWLMMQLEATLVCVGYAAGPGNDEV